MGIAKSTFNVVSFFSGLAIGLAGLVFIAILSVFVFGPYLFESERAKKESPDKDTTAIYYMSSNEGNFAPYADYVEIRKSYKFWHRPNIDTAPFVGYCDKSNNKELITWASDNELIISCVMTYCGIKRKEPQFGNIKITYNISGQVDSCNL